MYLAHNQRLPRVLGRHGGAQGRDPERGARSRRRRCRCRCCSRWAIRAGTSRAQYAALVRFGLWDELIALEPPDQRAVGLTAAISTDAAWALRPAAACRRRKQALAQLHALRLSTLADHRRGRTQHAPGGHRGGRTDARGAHCCHRTPRRGRDRLAARRRWPPRTRSPTTNRPTGSSRRASCSAHSFSCQASRPTAETVLLEDLRRNPDNGWSLYGLSLAAKAQGRGPRMRRASRAGNRRPPGGTPMCACRVPHSGMQGVDLASLRVRAPCLRRPAAGW